ncbi:hypothetical protein [Oceanobacillus sp. FSL K6-3682]|uniref:hypothetical protein n=1 Tax=Oceanobacillus sp. FSL K6-3682 TaxID=2921503 RepID=UPI0030DB3283
MEITTIFTVFVVVFTSIILAFLYYLYFWGYSKGELSRKKLVKFIVITAFFGVFGAGGLIFSTVDFMS